MALAELKRKQDEALAEAQLALTQTAFDHVMKGEPIDEKRLVKLLDQAGQTVGDFESLASYFSERKAWLETYNSRSECDSELAEAEAAVEAVKRERQAVLKNLKDKQLAAESAVNAAAAKRTAADEAAVLLRNTCQAAEQALKENSKRTNEAATYLQGQRDIEMQRQRELTAAKKREKHLRHLVTTGSSDSPANSREDNRRMLNEAIVNAREANEALDKAAADVASAERLHAEVVQRRHEIERQQLEVWPRL